MEPFICPQSGQKMQSGKQAGIPQEFRTYKTKPELALDIVRRQKANGVKFDFVGADGLYGNAPHFLDSLDKMGLLFVVEVHSNERVYEQVPLISIPEAAIGRGRKPSAYKCEGKPVEVRDLIQSIPKQSWEDIDIRQGTKGMLRCRAHVRKVYTWEKEQQRVVSGCWLSAKQRQPTVWK